MNNNHHATLKILLIPLLAGAIFTQRLIDPGVSELHKGEKSSPIGLSNEFILGPALGLQQAVAGALWVRADEFFHEGDYDAILPMVRMVTWLDPHQIDVYITGAWHLAYNFTDANERSDRRYIPAAQKLLEEGVENNKDIYDIPFELGWQNTDKIKNYERAEFWFRDASGKKGTDQQGRTGQPAPMFVWHQLAHSLERQGRIDEALDIWRRAYATTSAKLKGSKPEQIDYTVKSTNDSEKHNLELTLKRRYSRLVHEIDFELDNKITKSVNPQTGEPSPRDSYLAAKSDEGVPVGSPRLPALQVKWDTAFDAHVTFPQAKVLEPRGQFNVGDGGRVTVKLHDEDWHDALLTEFKFDIDQQQTIMVDQHSVRDGKWGRKIDMSKDPKMYSFSRKYYYLVFDFDPRGTSPFIQDKFGWSGEGMTDKKYLWIDRSPKVENRRIRKVFKISKDQIMAAKPVTEADVVPNDVYERIQQLFRKAAEDRQQAAEARIAGKTNKAGDLNKAAQDRERAAGELNANANSAAANDIEKSAQQHEDAAK